MHDNIYRIFLFMFVDKNMLKILKSKKTCGVIQGLETVFNEEKPKNKFRKKILKCG